MTTQRERWRELSDTCNSKGQPLTPPDPGPFDDLWDLLTPKQQMIVARGELSLEELVDRITTEPDGELCHSCCKRTITRPVLGLCELCARRAMTDALVYKLSEIETLLASATAKKALQRSRDRLDPDRPRGHAPFRTCEDCGERLPARTGGIIVEGDNVCLSCRDLRERRHPECS
ncbi:MAG: hypothetical protein Q7W16_07925 [Coriobacteriia bacterium]|nr:hypothetical protein [Coriobacteriia bacterium]